MGGDDGTRERDAGWILGRGERIKDDDQQPILQDLSLRQAAAVEALSLLQSLRGKDGSPLPDYDDVHWCEESALVLHGSTLDVHRSVWISAREPPVLQDAR